MKIDMYGFRLCCGVLPEQESPHNMSVRCPVCGRRKAVIGGYHFLRQFWNAFSGYPGPRTVAEADVAEAQVSQYRYCDIPTEAGRTVYEAQMKLSHSRMGSCDTRGFESVLFSTSMPLRDMLVDKKTGWTCVVDGPRWIQDIVLYTDRTIGPKHINWPTPKRIRYNGTVPHAYVSTWCCTDKTWGLMLYVNTATFKHAKMLDPLWDGYEERA